MAIANEAHGIMFSWMPKEMNPAEQKIYTAEFLVKLHRFTMARQRMVETVAKQPAAKLASNMLGLVSRQGRWTYMGLAKWLFRPPYHVE